MRDLRWEAHFRCDWVVSCAVNFAMLTARSTKAYKIYQACSVARVHDDFRNQLGFLILALGWEREDSLEAMNRSAALIAQMPPLCQQNKLKASI